MDKKYMSQADIDEAETYIFCRLVGYYDMNLNQVTADSTRVKVVYGHDVGNSTAIRSDYSMAF